MLAQLHMELKEYKHALKALVISLQTLEQIGARPDAEQVAGILKGFRQKISGEVFDPIWVDVTDGSPLPDWLTVDPQEESARQLGEFITGAVQAAKDKSPQAEEYFEAASKMAVDANLPDEFQKLGAVLRSILSGDFSPDLSVLPDELAQLITQALES